MFNTRPSYYDEMLDEDFKSSSSCHKCDDHKQQIESAKEFLEAVVEAIYSKNSLDVNQFESDLDELCHTLGVKLLPKEMQIQRKISTKQFYNEVQLFNIKEA